jgi:MoaA/NifB/PqqE/SkfB family radical SAM enzyme
MATAVREYSVVGLLLKPLRVIVALLRSLFNRKVKARFLYLEVTHHCNLRCVACYTGAGPEKEDALNLAEQKSVVRQAKEMGAKVVSLSGSGEPLLYKNLFELIDYIRGLNMAAVIFTNGTVLDEGAAEFLMSRNVFTYFKLYSLDPVVFDRMVGRKNAYKWVDYKYRYDGMLRMLKIPSGLKCLLDVRQTAVNMNLIRIETLITRINYPSVPDIARFCRELDIGFYLETPVFTGRAVENYDDVAVSGAAYENLYNELVQILGKEYFEKVHNHPCPVEKNPVVWTNGDIAFCSSRGARVGNVRDVPLDKLFLKAKKLKRKEDRLIAKHQSSSKYFRTCPARQYFEQKHGIPCDY